MADRPAVLLVDDDESVLDALTLQLRGDFRTHTAPDGRTALTVLAARDDIAVVVSDMLMPDMSGAQLLGEMRLRHPDTTRVLLTAQADVAGAIAAINDGGAFRFLTKPCPTAELRTTVSAAVAQHRIAVAERTVLAKTLRASLQALFGVLELANPAAFARAGRIRTLVSALCQDLDLDNRWEIEVAAMCSQLGAVALPPGVLEKMDAGLPLGEREQRMVDAMPDVAVRLLGDVPNLDDVLAIVRGLRAPDPAAPPLVSLGAGVIRAALDFENHTARGVSGEAALRAIEQRADDRHHPGALAALRRIKGITATPDTVRALAIAELEVGMRMAEDVATVTGAVLIGRGTRVTELLLERLMNYRQIATIAEPVLAVIPADILARWRQPS
ncbi:response regulator [Catenuloplanes indicus]|uniref:FixJ family two-component response regulator n=1 Tax=Catenuloplanes indicus TaxID=137267 RepID=A0AAE4B3Z0_9ACTN|nr:response regulator [Catenuloplanes indicus]MDQ0370743.1 FixJ family two-component response regulator [Catenuloplanes indicus]